MQNVINDLPAHTELVAPRIASPTLAAIDQLLRDVPGFLERIREGRNLAELARAMILTVAVGAAVFGAAMGAHRGGLQVLYAAIKLPAVMLLTTAVCAPALTAFNAAFRRETSLRRDLSLVLSSLALTCLVLAAQAPIVFLAVELGAAYHTVILLVVGCCCLAGIVGVTLFQRGLGMDPSAGRWTVGIALLMVFAVVGTQMSWTLRPFLVRPRTPEAPFIRTLEGSFLEAVLTSSRSARGIYWRESAPLPGDSRRAP
jgi:hypothetical protein